MSNLSKFQYYSKRIRSYYLLIVFILICIVFSFIMPNFFSADSLLNILKQSTFTGILAIGMTLVIISGGFDLSVGAVVALSGWFAGSFAISSGPGKGIMSNFEASSINGDSKFLMVFIPVIVGLAVGIICGAINGALVVYGKIPSFIATLGMLSFIRGLLLVISDGKAAFLFNENFLNIGRGFYLGIPIIVIIFIAVILLGSFLINFTRFGRYIYAIGGNETGAVLSGVRVNLTKMAVYIFSGFLAGLVGIMLTSRVMSGTTGAGTGYELAAIAAAAIGGTSLSGGIGTIRGTVIGILLLGVLSNALTVMFVSVHFQQIIVGIIIIIAIIFDKLGQRKTAVFYKNM